MNPARSWPVLAILMAGAFFAHWNALPNHFTRDDFVIVHDNRFIQDLGNLPKLLSRDYLSRAGDLEYAEKRDIGSGEFTYRPVATLSYFGLYALFKKNAFGYHLFGILLHALNAFLVFRLVLAFFRRSDAALFASLLFAVHPVFIETINSVTFNEDPLAFLFLGAGLLAHQKGRSVRASALFLAACLSKEAALVFPALILLWDFFSADVREIPWKRYALYGGTFLFYVWIRFFVMVSPDSSVGYPGGSWAVIPKTFAQYVLWLLWPGFVRPTMPEDPFLAAASWTQPDVLRALGLFAALCAGAFVFRKKAPWFFFGAAWLLIGLLPLAGLSRFLMAGRYLYLPSFGFFAMAGIGFSLLQERPGLEKGTQLIFGVLFLVSSFFSFSGHFNWRNELTLFEEAVFHQPDSATAHNALGYACLKQGDPGRAAAEYRVALSLDPSRAKSWTALGMSTYRRGFMDPALSLFDEAARLDPADGKPWMHRGIVHAYQGRTEEALQAMDEALRREPHSPEILDSLAVVYARAGRTEEARQALERALDIHPDYQPALKHREALLSQF